MEAQEKEVKEGVYIGEYLAKDVCAFCNVEWQEDMDYTDKRLRVVRKIWTMNNGYRSFCWPGAFLPMDWLAYRGMLKQAFWLDVFAAIGLSFLLVLCSAFGMFVEAEFGYSAGIWTEAILCIICIALFVCTMGHITINMYNDYVFKCLDERKLKNRKDVDCPELEASLRAQGKPSVIRAILFRLAIVLLFECLEGVWMILAYGVLGL